MKPMRLLGLMVLFSEILSANVPIYEVLKDIFDRQRKAPLQSELLWRHRFATEGTDFFVLEEQIIRDGNRLLFLWKGPSLSTPVAAQREKQAYLFSNNQALASRSDLILRYFFSRSSEEFRLQAINEQFLKPDQLQQYAPGFVLDGDPQTWPAKIREKYIIHKDIFLSQLKQGEALTVQGLEEGGMSKRMVFDQGLRGFWRFEWRDENRRDGFQTLFWNFDQITRFSLMGMALPKKSWIERDGKVVVTSELVIARPLSEKPLNELRNAWKTAFQTSVLSGSIEPYLRILLSYR